MQMTQMNFIQRTMQRKLIYRTQQNLIKRTQRILIDDIKEFGTFDTKESDTESHERVVSGGL